MNDDLRREQEREAADEEVREAQVFGRLWDAVVAAIDEAWPQLPYVGGAERCEALEKTVRAAARRALLENLVGTAVEMVYEEAGER